MATAFERWEQTLAELAKNKAKPEDVEKARIALRQKVIEKARQEDPDNSGMALALSRFDNGTRAQSYRSGLVKEPDVLTEDERSGVDHPVLGGIKQAAKELVATQAQGWQRIAGSALRLANDFGENEKGTWLDRAATSMEDAQKSTDEFAGEGYATADGIRGFGKMGLQNAPILISTYLTGGAAAGATSLAGRAAGLAKTAQGAAKVANAARWAGAGGAAAAGFSGEYGDARQQTLDKFKSITPEQMRESEKYAARFKALEKELYLAGATPDDAAKQAYEETVDALSEKDANIVGVVNSLIEFAAPGASKFFLGGGKLSSKSLANAKKFVNLDDVKDVSKQFGQEFLQEGFTSLATDDTRAKAMNDSVDWGQVGKDAFVGGTLGAIMGGGAQFSTGQSTRQRALAQIKAQEQQQGQDTQLGQAAQARKAELDAIRQQRPLTPEEQEDADVADAILARNAPEGQPEGEQQQPPAQGGQPAGTPAPQPAPSQQADAPIVGATPQPAEAPVGSNIPQPPEPPQPAPGLSGVVQRHTQSAAPALDTVFGDAIKGNQVPDFTGLAQQTGLDRNSLVDQFNAKRTDHVRKQGLMDLAEQGDLNALRSAVSGITVDPQQQDQLIEEAVAGNEQRKAEALAASQQQDAQAQQQAQQSAQQQADKDKYDQTYSKMLDEAVAALEGGQTEVKAFLPIKKKYSASGLNATDVNGVIDHAKQVIAEKQQKAARHEQAVTEAMPHLQSGDEASAVLAMEQAGVTDDADVQSVLKEANKRIRQDSKKPAGTQSVPAGQQAAPVDSLSAAVAEVKAAQAAGKKINLATIAKKHGVTILDVAKGAAAKPEQEALKAKPSQPLALQAPQGTATPGDVMVSRNGKVMSQAEADALDAVANTEKKQMRRDMAEEAGNPTGMKPKVEKPARTEQKAVLPNLILRTDGKPFPDEKQANRVLASKKLTETHEVVSVEGGKAISPKKAVTAKNQVDPEKDDILAAIAKLGGIDRAQAKSQGIDPADFSRRAGGIHFVFRKNGGKTLDGMAEALSEMGYPVTENGDYTINALLDALDAALRGSAVGTPMFHEAKAQAMYEEEAAQREIDAMFDSPGNSAEPDWLSFGADDFVSSILDGDITPNAVIASELAGIENERTVTGTLEAAGQKVDANPAPSSGAKGIAAAVGSGTERQQKGKGDSQPDSAVQDFGLKIQTEAERLAEEQRQSADLEAKRQADEAVRLKAQADREISSFTLTGSDLPADVAMAAGQKDLFAPRTRGEKAAEKNQPRSDATISDADYAQVVEAAKYLKDIVYSMDNLVGDDTDLLIALSSDLGKSGRDTILMDAFGIDRSLAHTINNRLDDRKPHKLRAVDMGDAFTTFPMLRKVVDDAKDVIRKREERRSARDAESKAASQQARAVAPEVAAVEANLEQGDAARITPEAAGDMKAGDIIKTSNGDEYVAMRARHDFMDAHPIVDGKPVVNRDSTVRFHLNPNTASAYPERNHAPIYKTGRNQYEEPVRGMTEEGRAKDGKPIIGGDKFRTSSGRETTPYPHQKSEKYASQWLIDNATAEAEARGDDFNAPIFRRTTLLKNGRLTDADRDSMLMYLFGEQPKVVPSILKPLTEGGGKSARQDNASVLSDRYAKSVDEWNRLSSEYKDAKGPQKESIRMKMDALNREQVAIKAEAYRNAEAERRLASAKIASEKYGAMGIGTKIGIIGHDGNDSIYWEKTGENQWSRRGIGSTTVTITNAEMEGSREIKAAEDLDAMFDDVLEEVTGKPKVTNTPKASVESAFTGEPDPKNSAPMQELGGFAVGDKVAISGRSVSDGVIRQLFTRQSSGGEMNMARVEIAGGKTLDLLTDNLSRQERTAGQAAASAAKNTGMALGDAIDGLGKLFGGNKLSSGLTFDEDTYAKAKPYFIAAIAHLRAAGGDLREAMRAVVKMVVDKFGADAAGNMKPYVVQFISDVRDGKVDDNAAGDATGKSLTDTLYQHLKNGTLPKDNNGLRKLVAEFDGGEVDNTRLKVAQENLEAAIVMHSRDIAAAGGTDKEIFSKLLDVYSSQPNLNIRTSTSMENQAYSTPAPLAFLASRLAGINGNTVVLEPTAGTGMLLMGADPKNSFANELNPGRADILRAQGFNPTTKDAATDELVPSGKKIDAVITNPPFGSVKDADGKATKVSVDGYKIGKIDHLIAARALDAMSGNGKATLIIGADKVAGGVSTDDRIFFNWLYSHYNVTGHFEIDGDLYKRQGAGWPVRVITINGRARSSNVSPMPGTIQRVNNWSEVYDQYSQVLGAQNSGTESGVVTGSKSTRQSGNDAAAAQNTDGQEGGGVVRQRNRTRGKGGPSNVGGTSSGTVRNQQKGASEKLADSSNVQRPDERTNAQDQLEPGDKRGVAPAGRNQGNAGGADAAKSAGGALVDADNAFQTKYIPRSARKDDGVLVPINMAQPTQDSLSVLEDAVGDIDQYAANELGYDSVEELHDALMGLQVDSVASAIYQIKERGKGVIIADQTGIGKGRQAAAIIRWSHLNGYIPVFITVKPSLFTDMYNDIADIGSNDIEPFIVNKEEWISSHSGDRMFTNKQNTHGKTLQKIANTGLIPEGRNAIFVTYSQINKDNVQRNVLNAVAPNAVFILDESHNAGGDSGTGDFIRSAIAPARGVTYLSATFAKRPDNMPLYFRTDIGDAIGDGGNLMSAMESGGLPLQTVVSNNLVSAGQMFRRERSYDGVNIDTIIDTENRDSHEQLSDAVTEALRRIVAADRAFHNGYVRELKKQMKALGSSIEDSAGNNASESVDHTEFSSVVHNFIRQMLLGMKADTAANEAIAAIKRGDKPLLALENTMGSFLNEYAANNNLSPGQSLGDFDYRTVLSRALDKSRYIIFKDDKGNKEKQYVPIDDLDPATREVYDEAQSVIDGLDINIPVSPLDWMRYRIEESGYTVAEITGRELAVDYSKAQPVLTHVPASERMDKVNTTRMFNDGRLDAIILNVAGSTGISLHASEKFKDQRKRHMIVVQPAQDINIFMQMLGRIHRTGQVKLPSYAILNADLPTEKRPTALLNKKMKSLNANTSSNTESATSIKSQDMLNKYGDQVIGNYLLEHPELAMEIDVHVDEDGVGKVDLSRTVTGRMALMPVSEQKDFYTEVEDQYNNLIEYLNETNQNELEPRTFDFEAEVIKEATLVEATDPTSPFGQEAVYGEYKIKAQGKQMTPDEVKSEYMKHLSGKTGSGFAEDMINDLLDRYAAQLNALRRSHGIGKTLDAEKYEAWLKRAFGYGVEGSADRVFVEKMLKRAVDQYAAGEPLVDITRSDLRTGEAKGISFIEDHEIGSAWRVDINGDVYNAVITNVRNTHKGVGSPFSMSKIQVTLAVNGPIRTITIPASQWNKVEVSKLYIGWGLTIDGMFRDQVEGSGRAKIITGNLLAAYGELKDTKGTIINFTKKDGSIAQGILLPRKFDFKTNTRGDFMFRSAADAFKFLSQSRDANVGRFGISSRDAAIRVIPVSDGIKIIVPKSKARGGKYFLDKKLIAMVGDFVSDGNGMVVRVNGAKASEEALKYLMVKSPLYAIPSLAEEARSILGLPPAEAKLSVGEGSGPVLTATAAREILSADPVLSKAMPFIELKSATENIPAGAAKFLPAYHGSPFKFDKFSLDYMGKGEGAQVYGWGLYFAGKKAIADWYREVLSPFTDSFIPFQGREYDYSEGSPDAPALVSALADYYGVSRRAATGAVVAIRDNLGVIPAYSHYTHAVENKTQLQKEIHLLLTILRNGVEVKPKGQLYRVEIPEDDMMLHWDKPLSEQPESVRRILADKRTAKAFAKYAIRNKGLIDAIGSGELEGWQAYESLVIAMGGQEKASKFLGSIGVSGIKYLDGASRSKGEGNYNYVVFDDKAVRILETYYSAGKSGGPEGYYHNGKITLFPENIKATPTQTAEERLKWVAFHEVTHRGVANLAESKEYMEELRQAGKNPFIKNLAKKIHAKRQGTPYAVSMEVAIEEALAEAWAALQTGSSKTIKAQYGLHFPLAIRPRAKSAIARFFEVVKRIYSKAVGRGLTNGQVADLLRKTHEAGMLPDGTNPSGRRDSLSETVSDKPTGAELTEAQRQLEEQLAVADRMIAERGGLFAPNGQKSKLNRHQWAQVRTANFKRWFGDWEGDPGNASSVVDDNGEPKIVYHSGDSGLTEIRKSGRFGGIFVLPTGAPRYRAQEYQFFLRGEALSLDDMREKLDSLDDGGLSIYQSYISGKEEATDDDVDSITDALTNGSDYPDDQRVWDILGAIDEADAQVEIQRLRGKVAAKLGYGAVQTPDEHGMDTIMVTDSKQIKSATGNAGTFSGKTDDIRYSAPPTPGQPPSRSVFASVAKQWMFQKWTETLGTQLNTAMLEPLFKPTYQLVQRYLQHTSNDAYDAISVAPNLLGRLEDVNDYGREIKNIGKFKKINADRDAAAVPLFEGTRFDKKVYSDAVLKRVYNLTDDQVAVYREARAAIEASLDSHAKSVITKILLDAGAVEFSDIDMLVNRDLPADDYMEELRQRLDADILAANDAIAIQKTALSAAGVTAQDKASIHASIKKGSRRVELLEEAAKRIDSTEDTLSQLKREGYFPLMRWGKYTVTVKDAGGNVVDFRMVETLREKAALSEALTKQYQGQGMTVTSGTMDEGRFKDFRGISPETLALFAKELGVDNDEAYQEYLKLALPGQSALKRRIHRKGDNGEGIAGFSMDIQRTLAAFVMGNARHSARNIYGSAITKSVDTIPGDRGDVRGLARNLAEFVTQPDENSASVSIRNMLFVWNMGASVAFGALNLTQPWMMTLPWLSQFSGIGSVVELMGKASKTAAIAQKNGTVPQEYYAEYQQAVREGHVDPQNVFMLQGIERGGSGLGSSLLKTVSHGMGMIAAATESYNRKLTLFAALDVARAKGLPWLKSKGFDSAYAFAVQAVAETQGVYNKGNRPTWARGPIGAVLLVFKQYAVNWIEMAVRMGRNHYGDDRMRKGLMMMLGLLFAMAGGLGLPGAEDLKDIAETAMGSAGKPVNIERQMQMTLGKGVADAVMAGPMNILVLNSIGLDMHGRMSMGNLIPGTGALNPYTSTDAKLSEGISVMGAGTGLLKKASDSIAAAQDGRFLDAAQSAAPRAIESVMKGVRMMAEGKARDARGNVLMETTPWDAAAKIIDFQPASVAITQRERGRRFQDKNIQMVARASLRNRLITAYEEKDAEKIRDAEQALDEWNQDNPLYQIKLKKRDLRKAAKKRGASWMKREETPKGLEWMDEYADQENGQ